MVVSIFGILHVNGLNFYFLHCRAPGLALAWKRLEMFESASAINLLVCMFTTSYLANGCLLIKESCRSVAFTVAV